MGSNDYVAAAGFGIITLLYALPFSIVGLVVSSKETKVKPPAKDTVDDFLSLLTLKEKGVLTEEEFNIRKQNLLKNL